MKLKTLKLMLVIVLGWSATFSWQEATSQETSLADVRRELSCNHFLNAASRHLRLSEEQERLRQLLLTEFVAWHEAVVFEKDFEEQLHDYNEQMYERFSALLEVDQKVTLDQFLYAKYYSIQLKLNPQGMRLPDVREIDGTLVWMHPDVIEVLGVGDAQVAEVNALTNRFGDANTELKDRLKRDAAKLFTEWQRKLFDLLDSSKKSEFEQALGKSFEFDKKTLSTASLAYNFGPLPLAQNKVSFGLEATGIPSPLLLAGIDSSFGKELSAIELKILLQDEKVGGELGLDPSNSTMKAIEDELENDVSWPEVVKIENSFGLDGPSKESTGSLSYSEDVMKSIEVAGDKLYSKLNAAQKKRLVELRNQLVIEFGWKEVPLAHPNWRMYLNLDKAQVAEFDSTNKEFIKKHKKLVEMYSQKSIALRERIKSDLLGVLSDEQRQKATVLFGPFLLLDLGG